MELLGDIAARLGLGLSVALSWSNLFYCFFGVTLGTLVGVMPGIGALTAVALLLPITYHLDPTSAIVMLAGVFYGSSYGGSTASILLNLPGTPNNAVSCLDGYPMSKQGRAGVALLMTTVASFAGGSIGIALMMLFSPIIVAFALDFGAAEYFALMLLGLVAAASIAGSSPAKGIAMVVLGITLGLVGADQQTLTLRFTFGIPELYDGINLIAVALGLFGLSEVIATAGAVRSGYVDRKSITFRSMIPTPDDIRRSRLPLLRGAGIGAFFGALPGAGGTISSFMAYAVEKRVARDPTRFGHGAIEGIMAPEAANNAADQTAFIPMLTLGIPGNVVTALLMGALMIHGIVPGPLLMSERPDMFWGLIMSFWIGNLLLLVLNIPLIGIWIRVLAIPYQLLYPAILMFVCIGVYSVNNSYFDILVAVFFGIIGYIMRLLDFHPAPLLLGLVLGPLMEQNLRRALVISRGDFIVFLERPMSATFIGITAALLIWSVWSAFRGARRRR